MNFVDPEGLKTYSDLLVIPKTKDAIDDALSTQDKFTRCMKRASRVCSSDFGAQMICGTCQAEAENKCRLDLFLDTGSDIVTPWWF